MEMSKRGWQHWAAAGMGRADAMLQEAARSEGTRNKIINPLYLVFCLAFYSQR